MKFLGFSKNIPGRDGVALSGGSGLFKILGIVVIGGMTVIIAVGVALGVGLGVGLQKTPAAQSTLPPPTISCSSLTTTCGCPSESSTLSSRIIGGSVAGPASWPWMVYIISGGVRVCSGFLISNRHVLTAADCVTKYAYNVTLNIGTSFFSSAFFGINITNSTAPSLNATGIVSNSTYQSYVLGNIAVLTLIGNVTYAANIKPCCLSGAIADPIMGMIGVLAGFGETSTNTLGIPALLLQQAVFQVRSPISCSTQAADVFCAGSNTASACPIDAGGPFMISENNVWTCVGVMTSTTSCVNSVPFTRISYFYPFIQNVTNITSFSN